VICARGRASAAAAAALATAGIEATNVAGGMVAWSRLLVAQEVPIGTPTTVVQLRREARGCLSYLVVSDGEALVVDPAPNVAAYVAEADRLDVRITRILDTHVHADHLSGMRELAAATGATMHLSDAAMARGVRYRGVFAVRDGAHLPVGRADLKVVALPGHTSDMTGVVVDGRAIVAGDSLLVGSVARPDLEAGDDGMYDAAKVLQATIRDRVLALGDDVILLPCHYAGGRRSEPLAPTLGEVRAATPLLAIEDPDAFAAATLAAMPPRPARYLEIIAANLAGADTMEAAGLEVGANNCAATR
jgi:glyoxylase-like metal-dependent hydrolase (beta-lactamase superfamily II)